MGRLDIVIPYLHDPKSNGADLRFCLRSIEKHLTNYGDIFIVGDLPNWIINVKHIPANDSLDPRQKEFNIYRKIILACEHPEVTDTFLKTSDDEFLLSRFEATNFPNFSHRSLFEGAQANQGAYRATMIHTKRLLDSMLLPTRDYDAHVAVRFEKKKFIEAFKGVVWKDNGFAIKSVYGNFNEIEPTPCTDLKITTRKRSHMEKAIQGRDWFSIGNSHPETLSFLASLFPLKSKYEK